MHIKKIYNIQGLRGFAALSVCIYHCMAMQYTNDDFLHHYSSNPILFTLGCVFTGVARYGVDVFFVISGFIISLIISKEEGGYSFKYAVNFLIKRFFRVYPLYWVSLLIIIPMVMVIDIPAIKRLFDFNVIFLLTNEIPFQPVAWTLGFEIFFYIGTFLFLCCSAAKNYIYFLIIWGILVLALLLCNSGGLIDLNYFIFKSYRILDFFFGGLLPFFLQKTHRFVYDKYLCLMVGFLLFLIGNLLSISMYPLQYLSVLQQFFYFSCSATLLAYGIIGLEHRGGISCPNIFIRLGDISYSIYLLHFPFIHLGIVLIFKFDFLQNIPKLLLAVIEIILTILAARVSYVRIELFFIQLSTKIKI